MRTEHALIELAHEARSPRALREGALACLRAALDADVGIFVELRGGRVDRSLDGLARSHATAIDAAWDASGRELGPVKAHAMRAGAATDRRVLGEALEATTLYRRVMAPIGGTETLVVVPTHAGRPLGLIALGRCRARFSDAALAHAGSLVPVLSLACRAASRPPEPLPPLTGIERDLLDYLALGLGTKEIAAARGTSFFTVRNQLSALYRKLDVANRAEAIGTWRARRAD